MENEAQAQIIKQGVANYLQTFGISEFGLVICDNEGNIALLAECEEESLVDGFTLALAEILSDLHSQQNN